MCVCVREFFKISLSFEFITHTDIQIYKLSTSKTKRREKKVRKKILLYSLLYFVERTSKKIYPNRRGDYPLENIIKNTK